MKRASIGLLASLALLTACIEPVQYGGPIPIDTRGAPARLVRACTISEQPMCRSLGEEDAGDGGDGE